MKIAFQEISNKNLALIEQLNEIRSRQSFMTVATTALLHNTDDAPITDEIILGFNLVMRGIEDDIEKIILQLEPNKKAIRSVV